MKRHSCLAVLLWAVTTFTSPLWAQQFVFNPYRQDQGLNNISISAMAFDRQGFLWTGTGNGVYRFLASSSVGFTTTKGISEFRITDVYVDPYGVVWAGTIKHLYRWNGSSFVQEGRIPISVTSSNHLASLNSTHLLVLDKNSLNVLEYDNLGNMVTYHPAFTDSQLQNWPSLREIHAIAVAADGTYWMGCGKQICSWKAGKLAVWNSSLGVPEEEWKTFLITPDRTIWAASSHRRIELSPWASAFLEHPLPNINPSSVYTQAPLIQDRLGNILTSTGDGLARWDGSSWHTIGTANGLHVSYITDLAFDSIGDLWIGTAGHGVIRWAGYGNYEAWTDSQGLPSPIVWSVLPMGDEIYVGTEKGPAIIDSHRGSVSTLFSGNRWDYDQLSCMLRDHDGILWGGTLSGIILRMEPRAHRVTQVAKLPYSVLNLNQDHADRIWISTKGGIYRMSPDEDQQEPEPVDQANKMLRQDAAITYQSCSTKDGSTWFLTATGLLRFQGEHWSSPRADDDSAFAYLNDQLQAMACGTDGSLWITGPKAGIWQITPSGGKLTAKEVDLPEGFRKFTAKSILVDHRGWIWIGMDSGLLAWNGSLWSHVTHRAGLIWDDINEGSLHEGTDGSIWAGSTSGVVHVLHPEHIFDTVLLSVTIYNIQQNGNSLSSGAPFTIPWAAQSLRFQFAAPGTVSHSDLLYSYRIPQLDTSWITTEEREAIFPPLSNGSYTFQIFAHDFDSDTNSPITSIDFQILPPWWRTKWFYTFCFMLTMVALWLLYRLRTYQLLKNQKVLEETVANRTRELEESHRALHIQATHDALTGLANRAAILEKLHEEIRKSRSENRPLTVVVADIDHFKRINDTYGHLVGDAVLRHFSEKMRVCIRASDYAGRYGGEEFLIILPNLGIDLATKRLINLHECISNLLFIGEGDEFTVTCSLGSTILIPQEMKGIEADQLLARADRALYQAKQSGRNRFILDIFPYDQTMTWSRGIL